MKNDIARWMREEVAATPSGYRRDWADLLDPQPAALREQVRDALWTTLYFCTPPSGGWPGGDRATDAVLAVVADRLAAEQEKPPRSWGMEVTPDFYAGLATAESIIRGGAS